MNPLVFLPPPTDNVYGKGMSEMADVMEKIRLLDTIRNNPEDFVQVGFIGTPWHNAERKWGGKFPAKAKMGMTIGEICGRIGT